MHTTKTLSAIIILLALIMAVGYYSYKTLSQTSRNLENYITEIEENTKQNNWKKAEENLTAVQADWSKVQHTWSVLIDHVEIDNIDSTMSRMEKFIETRDTPSALAEAASLKLYVKHIPEKEFVSLKNLF